MRVRIFDILSQFARILPNLLETMEKRSADSLIHARWVVPVSGDERYLDHHSVVIRSGNIIDILPTERACEAYEAEKQTSLESHVLIPGLINTHTHAAMSLFR
jgi:5-methylthioadenosine/S-adenosylhomocysteine deaminase